MKFILGEKEVELDVGNVTLEKRPSREVVLLRNSKELFVYFY